MRAFAETGSPMSAEKQPSDKRRVLGAAGLISGLLLVSRMLGMVRDGLLARALGHTWLSDTFLIAFEVPNLARRVLGEGSLSAFIVPIFTRFRAQEGEARGWRFANNALTTMTIYTFLLTAICWLGAKWLFVLFGGAEALVHGKVEVLTEGTRLVRIMIPSLMFLAIAAMMMGLLHSLGHFFTPTLGGVVLNVVLIGVLLLCLGWTPEQIVTPLAWAAVAATVIRIAVMIPALVRRGWRAKPVFKPRSDGMVRLYGLMLPATAGLGVAHINIAVDRMLARWISDGAVTYLSYANRIALFPIALVANALQVAMLPTLSRRLAEGNLPALHRTMNMALRLTLLLFVPATVGLTVLSYPIIAVIFQGRNFDALGSANTAWALIFYALGLVPSAGLQVIIPLYYARHDTRTPLRAGAIAMLVNVVLNLMLMNTALKHGGLALATSVAALVNVTLLIRWLGVDLHGIIDRHLVRLVVETSALSAVMGVACWLGWRAVQPAFLTGSFGTRALLTGALCAGGAMIYILGAKLLRIREIDEALNLLMRRRKPLEL
jgi:putative peptidoglycan lipid II flippase